MSIFCVFETLFQTILSVAFPALHRISLFNLQGFSELFRVARLLSASMIRAGVQTLRQVHFVVQPAVYYSVFIRRVWVDNTVEQYMRFHLTNSIHSSMSSP